MVDLRALRGFAMADGLIRGPSPRNLRSGRDRLRGFNMVDGLIRELAVGTDRWTLGGAHQRRGIRRPFGRDVGTDRWTLGGAHRR